MVYTPATKVSTLPSIIIEFVKSPSKLSKAETPGSVKVEPNSILIVSFPCIVINGDVLSTIVTVLVFSEAAFPELSDTLYLKI